MASLEQMSDPMMPDINLLGKHDIQLPHSQGGVWLDPVFPAGCGNDYQADKRHDTANCIFHNTTQYLQEYTPVGIFHKDTLPGILLGSDMIYRCRIF